MKELLDGFSVERLEEIITSDHVQCGDASVLARIALAVKQAQPLVLDLKDVDVDAVKVAFARSMGRYSGAMFELAALERDFIIPEAATLSNINELCPLDLNISQTDFATGWNECRQSAITHGRIPPIVRGINANCRGWNACRDAMRVAE